MTRLKSKLAQTHVALTGPTRQQVLQLMMTRNSLIFGNIMHPNEFILLDFETIISTYSVVFYASRYIYPPENKAGLKRKYWYQYQLSSFPPTSQNVNMIASDVLILTKKALTEEHLLDAPNVVFSYAW